MNGTRIQRVARFSFSLLILGAWADCLAAQQQASQLRARHQGGQTLLTFAEAQPLVTTETIAAERLRDLRREADRSGRIRYRVYRSSRPIDSVGELTPVAVMPPLTGWNIDYYGDLRPEHVALRYVVQEGGLPVSPETGICAFNPAEAGKAYYAVTAVIDGQEGTRLGASNSLSEPVLETVGQGVPVLQRIEQPKEFNYVRNPTLHYFVRWESPPNCSQQGKPIDYLVAIPENPAQPAPVGIHLHCWGGSLNGGYGWWYQAEQGHLLLASNQVPYDWWTGYHERYWDGPADEKKWEQGVVRPYSQRRLLSFLDWMATRWKLDLTRTHVAGSSMGGSGAPMFAIRHPERIAWAASWVGVHVPLQSPTFRSSYTNVYGQPDWNVKFEDGTPVWDHFDDTWYLRKYPQAEIGLIAFSNGKNDGGIGWRQAVDFHRALQETRRPHVFVWGQQGHGQRAVLPIALSDRFMPLDLRIDQSQPAFTRCSLDDDPGNGEPQTGASQGQSNQYLFWETSDVVDTTERWEMTVGLIDRAPQDACTVDITPRRVQQFKPAPGTQVRWTNRSLAGGGGEAAGNATVDQLGLITLPGMKIGKGRSRITILR
jgi:pimeloyl-ACP methyl ester carboxylesterase